MENFQEPGGEKDIKQALRTAYLVAGFLKQTLNQEEKEELDEWILASDENMIQFEQMTDEKKIADANSWFSKMNVEEDLQKVKKKIRGRFWRYTIGAAAVVIILLAAGVYFLRTDRGNDKPSIVQHQDILPGANSAILKLSDGKIIALRSDGPDSTINDHLKIQGKEGQLIYETGAATDIVYHTLEVPRKGHYKVILPDGTKVWLNAASSIRYPVRFTDSERKVFVTGESFFDIAEDKSKPFRVVAGEITIEALGTQFNVNAYANEPFFSTTLVNGSVMITKGAQENILKPGQQAILNENSFAISNVNTDSATAWKNNQFKFINTPLDAIMRQVERWYDAEVIYQDKISLHLNATIERDVPVSKLLRLFEQTEQVKFKVDGKKIIVMK